MRSILFMFILLLPYSDSLAQSEKTKNKVVSNILETNLRLTSRIALNKGYRNVLTVELPENTIEWYYAFVATDDKEITQSINLLKTLTGLVSSGGISALITLTPDALDIQKASGVCNVYVVGDRDNLRLFQSEKAFKYYQDYSRDNISKGVVRIKMDKFPKDKTTFFICIENQKMTLPVNVNIEVDAIVEKPYIDDSNSSHKVKDFTYQIPESQEKSVGYQKLAWMSYQKGDIEKAIELNEKALQIEKTNGDIKADLGLFYLIKGNENKAMEMYVESVIDFKQKGNSKKALEEAIKKIDEEVSKNKNFNNWELIRDYLQKELNNLEETSSSNKE